MASLKPWFLLTHVYSCLSFFTTATTTSEEFVFKPFKIRWNYTVQILEFFFFWLNTHSSCGLVAGLNLHKPTRVTTALEVSGIWKFRNLSFPILQNSSVSFPTQATVSLIKILYIESPWKLSGGKRFLGQASWVFLSWILLTIAQKQT